LSTQPKRRPRSLTDDERARWFAALAEDEVAKRQDLFDLSAFLLATGLRIGEALAVVWREVDLDSGELGITSTLLRVTGKGLIRKRTKSAAGGAGAGAAELVCRDSAHSCGRRRGAR
jgi:integrase